MKNNIKKIVFCSILMSLIAVMPILAKADNGSDDAVAGNSNTAASTNGAGASNGGDDVSSNTASVINSGNGSSNTNVNGSDDTTKSGVISKVEANKNASNGSDDGVVSNGSSNTNTNGSDDTVASGHTNQNGSDDVNTSHVGSGTNVTTNTGANGTDDTKGTGPAPVTPPADPVTPPAGNTNGNTNNSNGTSGSSSGSGSSGGGSSSSSGGGSGSSASSLSLGITQCPYLANPIVIGAQNNSADIMKLQSFLNTNEGSKLTVNGIYDLQTITAVKTFQQKYASDILTPWGVTNPSGNAYLTTEKKINEIVCKSNVSLTAAQLSEISNFKNGSHLVVVKATPKKVVTPTTIVTKPVTEETVAPTTTPAENTNPVVGSTQQATSQTASAASANPSFFGRAWTFVKHIFGR